MTNPGNYSALKDFSFRRLVWWLDQKWSSPLSFILLFQVYDPLLKPTLKPRNECNSELRGKRSRPDHLWSSHQNRWRKLKSWVISWICQTDYFQLIIIFIKSIRTTQNVVTWNQKTSVNNGKFTYICMWGFSVVYHILMCLQNVPPYWPPIQGAWWITRKRSSLSCVVVFDKTLSMLWYVCFVIRNWWEAANQCLLAKLSVHCYENECLTRACNFTCIFPADWIADEKLRYQKPDEKLINHQLDPNLT